MSELPDTWRCIECEALLNDQTLLLCEACHTLYTDASPADQSSGSPLNTGVL